ncbi:hypothetical protein P7K49_030350, partial [Saguinus oedipus]
PGAPRRPRERPLHWRNDAFASGDAPKPPKCPETFVYFSCLPVLPGPCAQSSGGSHA